MAQANDDRASGFSELLDSDSEELAYRGGTIEGIVDRGLDAKALSAGQIDFDERDKTHIEFLRSAVTSVPRVGEFFEDSDNRFHRISVVRRTSNTYKCDCEVGGPDS